MQHKHQGFSLLEVLLTFVLVGIAVFGVYRLYEHAKNSYQHDTVVQQVVRISVTFNALYSARLTQALKQPEDFTSLLYNSNQLPSNYFQVDSTQQSVSLVNMYGPLTVSQASVDTAVLLVPVATDDFNARDTYCQELKANVFSCVPAVAPIIGGKSNALSVTLKAGD